MMTTSITFHLRPSQAAGRQPGKLFIRIIRARRSRYISRPYPIYADEWDEGNKQVILPKPEERDGNSVGETGRDSGQTERRQLLSAIDESMKNDLNRLQEIVSILSACGDFTADEVAERFLMSLNGDTVRGYAAIMADRLREAGSVRTARAYRSAARSLTAFNDGKDIHLSEINTRLMTAYERYLLCKGLKLNTVSFYLRNLRALYFRAVGEKIISRQPVNPFLGMHTGVYETRRRALDDRQIKALAKLDEILADEPEEEEPDARTRKSSANRGLHDGLLYFLFCYHARGMSFVDLAHLRRQDVGEECLIYRRRKTGGLLEVKITEPMRKILSHFAGRTNGSEYLFPVIDSRREELNKQYETGLKRQNRTLKVLARMAGIAENLSTHAARHTWATLAKRLQVPLAVIGEALGHRDVKTTSIYLASFDRATMDELSVRLSDAIEAA